VGECPPLSMPVGAHACIAFMYVNTRPLQPEVVLYRIRQLNGTAQPQDLSSAGCRAQLCRVACSVLGHNHKLLTPGSSYRNHLFLVLEVGSCHGGYCSSCTRRGLVVDRHPICDRRSVSPAVSVCKSGRTTRDAGFRGLLGQF